jgi:uncharacterized protein
MASAEPAPELQFILKIASRCNLNCAYCYVYNKGDSSWRERPAFMTRKVFDAAVERIRRHCLQSGQDAVRVTFHGGEPTLVGARRFTALCEHAHARIDPVCRLELALQTNGTLIDDEWVAAIRDHEVAVGVSLDGPPDVHDALRVDHKSRGSYVNAVRGLKLIQDADVPLHVLCVIQLGADGLRVHEHLLALGVKRINYLLPDFTHEDIAAVRQRYGATPVADFLLPVLQDWWVRGLLDVRVSPFTDMARLILGGDTYIDLFGNRPYQYVFVEADGSIEGLDVLRICDAGLARVGLDVHFDDFAAIAAASPLQRRVMFEGPTRPRDCAGCVEGDTCGGGYLPHRYSAARQFDNRSVWCRDLLALFGRLRELAGIGPDETERRRRALHEMAHVGC